jgi:hypothetical protein
MELTTVEKLFSSLPYVSLTFHVTGIAIDGVVKVLTVIIQ